MSALCIFAAVRLFLAHKPDYGKSILGVWLFYTAVFFSIWIFQISVPPYLLPLTMLTVLGSCYLGYYLRLYDTSRVFDRYLHAFGTFSFALLTGCILDDFLTTGGSTLYRALFIVLLGNTLGVLFELTEMLHDSKKRMPKSQRGLRDTDLDLLFNLIGSILAGGFAYFLILQ